ncbi:MAG: toprim domain-containing protein [bacterium]|nr:toprim domain-containing protein [bacterium]
MAERERSISTGVADSIERLVALFERFPGIGQRQAQRFVQFLLRASPTLRREFIDALGSLSDSVYQCPSCMRFHAGDKKKCSMCSNPERDTKLLAVVASDADLAALERSGTFRGYYFVLGGTISLASEKTSGLRISQLLKSIPERRGLKEVILAFPANPEGDVTAVHVREKLAPLAKEHDFIITTLGRGLSTGSELEYADPETIKSALDSRR